MSIKYDTLTLKNLFDVHNDRKLALPNFQREFVWSLEDQKQLLASALADFPVGSILLLEGKRGDFSARPLGRQEELNPTDDCIYLLDGQQRLTCFYHYFCDPFGEAGSDWKSRVDATYNLVRNRWMLRVVPEQGESLDPFGYTWLHFRGIDVEPEELKDFVVQQRMNKTNPTRWISNPEWLIKEIAEYSGNEAMARLNLARELANRGLVPLWGLNGAKKESRFPLHGQVLQMIAQKRVEELEVFEGRASHEFLESAQFVRPDLFAAVQSSFEELAQAIPAMAQGWVAAVSSHLEGVVNRQIPVVTLPSEELERSIPIFEVMNKGGTPLATFDLVVAKMARVSDTAGAGDPGLTQMLVEHASKLELGVSNELWGDHAAERPDQWLGADYDFLLDRGSLASGYKNAFLNLLSLGVHARRAGADQLGVDEMKRKAILAIDPAEIYKSWAPTAEALGRAWQFLNVRAGVRTSSDLRNKLILIPLAFAFLDEDTRSSRTRLNQLEYWYWATAMSGTYTERQTENCVQDVKQLSNWIHGRVSDPFKARGDRALNSPGYSDPETLLRQTDDAGVASDVGDYLPQFVLSRNPTDFLDPQYRLAPWDTEVDLELHHVVPLAEATSIGESTAELRQRSNRGAILNSPLNLTFITRQANRKLGSRTVESYMTELADEAPVTHYFPLEASTYRKVPGEDREEFYRRILSQRLNHLKQRLMEHMGSLIAG